MAKVFDAKDRCVWCGEDTSFGSGRFVNRLPVGTDPECVSWLSPDELAAGYDEVSGYGCAECAGYECDRCGKQIYLDEDVADEDGDGHYHPECVAG